MQQRRVMNKPQNDFLTELAELSAEVKRDQMDAMSAGEKQLRAAPHRLLQLERDLAVPGVGMSDAARQLRILQMVEDEDF